jgi:acylphosphatase
VTEAVCRERIRFQGRVQGVGFRMRAQRVAIARGLAGWVCNDSDGTVLCELEGTKIARDGFLVAIDEVMSGHIDHLDRTTIPSDEPLMGFSIKLVPPSRR